MLLALHHSWRFAAKPFPLFLGITAVVLVASLPASSRGRTHRPGKTPLLFERVSRQTPQADYQVQDGTILTGGAPDAADDQAGGNTPGKVDTLDIAKAYQRANKLAGQAKGKVFKTNITPHWFNNNTQFWYRNDTRDDTRDFVVVHAEKGTRQPAFDHVKLAAGLSKATGNKVEANKLPFQSIEFTSDAGVVKFSVNGAAWQCDLTTYECSHRVGFTTILSVGVCLPLPAPAQQPEPVRQQDDYFQTRETPWDGEAAPADLDDDEAAQQKKGKLGGKGGGAATVTSPDGKWTSFVRDFNLWLRDKDGKETQLTKEGVEGNAFAAMTWSPDSKTVVCYRTEPGNIQEVYLIESSPKDQLPAKFSSRPYARATDKFPLREMHVVDVETMKAHKVDIERIDYPSGGLPQLRWNKDRTHFTFEKVDRGHQRFRLVEVEARTGKTRTLIDEKSNTFIWTVHAPGRGELLGTQLTYLDKSGEILYASEKSGWKHLYLVDAKTGEIKNAITQGEWVVRGIDKIDEAKREIWFRGSGKSPAEDPYHIHYYRVNFDGAGLVALTEGNGDHLAGGGKGGAKGGGGKAGGGGLFERFSPDGKYFIDTYSRPDMPPLHELRRVSDGKKVCDLEKADVSALEAVGWRAPEVFVAKGRDGQTDIWGLVFRPQNFDPTKKYPVIEYIYAGPHDSHVRKTFAPYDPMAALAELGFVVVKIEGMGTANRSRAFHDVSFQNIADAGFPDRILWIKALAKKYDYVDITRVGIYGTSAGGQSSTGALLFHPEFYKVAVSSCGCHDNRLDKASWNEQWMGAMGPHYEKQSNATNAHKLVGKLCLILGELDDNVPPESTLRVVDALIRAGKDFDLLVMPGLKHTGGGAYGDRRRMDFFVRHLLGVEPPDHNASLGKLGKE